MSAPNFHEIEIYKGQTFDKLLKQIHENSNEKSEQLSNLIHKLTEFIKSPDDATLLVPLIAQYLEVGIKNDDQLVKLAAIIQRFVKTTSSSNEDSSYGLTDEEKAELLANVKDASAKVVKMGSK